MASSRRYPAATVWHSYGAAGRAYTALANWEADTDIALAAVTTLDQDSSGTTLYVAATTLFDACELGVSTISVGGQILTILGVTTGISLTVSAITGTIASGTAVGCGFFLRLYDDASPYNDKIAFAGATISSSFFRGIEAAPGETVELAYSASSLGATEAVVYYGESRARAHNLTLSLTQNSAVNPWTVFANASDTRTVGCTIRDCTNIPGAGTANGVRSYNSTGTLVANCVIHNVDYGIGITTAGNIYAYNCTVQGCVVIGMWRTAGTAVATNVIVEDCATNWSGTWTATTCTDDDGVVFVDAANDDFRLDDTDAAARNLGTDLSGDAVFPFDDDLDGLPAVRNPSGWDIGADEHLFIESLAEGTSLGDTRLASTLLPVTVTEGGTFGEAQTGVGFYPGAVTEGGTFGEARIGVGFYPATVIEGLVAGDLDIAISTLRSVITEAASLAEAGQGAAVLHTSLSEGLAASDLTAILRRVRVSLTDGVLASDGRWFSADGLIQVSFSGIAPSVTATSQAPGVSLSGIAPSVTATSQAPNVGLTGVAPQVTITGHGFTLVLTGMAPTITHQ